MNPYTISPIVDGQYHVRMYLDQWMQEEEISSFKECYKKLCQEDNYFKEVCFLNGHILQYRSESLFPTSSRIDPKKKKVMIILGNPATHSVANGMFFYSKVDGHRHPFWGKLKEAKLIRNNPDKNDREIEAQIKKKDILNGDTSDEHILGLTTFYSLPTPVKPKTRNINKTKFDYGDAEGVEKLFSCALDKLQKMEYDRLNSYEFAMNAVWIFTQSSSYRYVKGLNRLDYWPLRNGGVDLGKILLMP